MSDPVSDLKHELLAAAERQQARADVRAGRRRLRAHLGRSRLLVAGASLAIASAAALLSAAPWSASPGFLARAQAALTPPAGTILHQEWRVTRSSTDPPCTVTNDPNELWVDETPPHRYRALLSDFPPEPQILDPRTLVCWNGTGTELGGTFDRHETLTFVPPNMLRASSGGFFFPLDPVGDLRESIDAGSAHDEGPTELDGRRVERIRIDPPEEYPFTRCPREPVSWYVDVETSFPVETHGFGVITLPGEPVVCFRVSMRYVTFEYLPRTEANLALTDIRAQHPDATGP